MCLLLLGISSSHRNLRRARLILNNNICWRSKVVSCRSYLCCILALFYSCRQEGSAASVASSTRKNVTKLPKICCFFQRFFSFPSNKWPLTFWLHFYIVVAHIAIPVIPKVINLAHTRGIFDHQIAGRIILETSVGNTTHSRVVIKIGSTY